MATPQALLNLPARLIASGGTSAPATDAAAIREMFLDLKQSQARYQPASYYLPLKRLTDVLISLTVIVFVVSWIYPIIALLIKLTSRGPVLFVQTRTGYMGDNFECLKFRTMYLNDDANIRQATSGDRRITPLGRVLRATHLDELPQLFNVFIGEMSIIGPRPHMLYHTRSYSQIIPYYNLRHEAKPGMTGLAQIKGYLGEINDDRELRKRVQWDIYYLKNRSVSTDVSVFLTTVMQVVEKALGIFRRVRQEER